MLFHQFHVPGLAHFSYAVGCARRGAVAIVDPERDVETYLRFAREERVRITHVLETHVHADYASGAAELALRTGAELCLSAYDQGETHQVSTPHRPLLEDETVEIGPAALRVVHTPGHTPEHISFLVFDRERSADVPLLMLTGDFLFAGSLGRPDLAGEDEAAGLARQLRRSVTRKLAGLPDGLALYPAHGPGSMCGSGAIGGSMTTLGFERRANPLLDPDLPEDEFIARVLAALPPSPEYFQRLRRLNCTGAVSPESPPGAERIDPQVFEALASDGGLVVDVRDAERFCAGHVPGAFALGAGPFLSTWAGWVLPADAPLLLVADDEAEREAAGRSLARVGLDDVRGHLAGGMRAWEEAGLPVAAVTQTPPGETWRLVSEGRATVVDVRGEEEWREGRVPGARLVPGWEIEAVRELGGSIRAPTLICRTGYISTVVASLLARAGVEGAAHVPGGMQAWAEAGLPVEADG